MSCGYGWIFGHCVCFRSQWKWRNVLFITCFRIFVMFDTRVKGNEGHFCNLLGFWMSMCTMILWLSAQSEKKSIIYSVVWILHAGHFTICGSHSILNCVNFMRIHQIKSMIKANFTDSLPPNHSSKCNAKNVCVCVFSVLHKIGQTSWKRLEKDKRTIEHLRSSQ